MTKQILLQEIVMHNASRKYYRDRISSMKKSDSVWEEALRSIYHSTINNCSVIKLMTIMQ